MCDSHEPHVFLEKPIHYLTTNLITNFNQRSRGQVFDLY